MNRLHHTHLHSIENANALESRFRRLVQNPKRILKKYIQPGMTVLDLGCGTGYFTIELARLTGEKGKVIAVDVQEGMLEILKQKIISSELKQQIEILHNQENKLGFVEKIDFVVAFYVFHEMKFIDQMIQSLKEVCKPESKILISEQKIHVSKIMFESIISKMKNNGFVVCGRPRLFFSRSVVMKTNKNS